MTQDDIVKNVHEMMEPIAQSVGVDVLEITYGHESQGPVLRVIIDKRGGVGIDDTTLVAKQLNPILDQNESMFKSSYRLSVSSAGIDRPLKTEADFSRHQGAMVEIKLYEKLDDQKIFRGKLLSYESGSVTIVDEDHGEKTFSLTKTAYVKRAVVF